VTTRYERRNFIWDFQEPLTDRRSGNRWTLLPNLVRDDNIRVLIGGVGPLEMRGFDVFCIEPRSHFVEQTRDGLSVYRVVAKVRKSDHDRIVP